MPIDSDKKVLLTPTYDCSSRIRIHDLALQHLLYVLAMLVNSLQLELDG